MMIRSFFAGLLASVVAVSFGHCSLVSAGEDGGGTVDLSNSYAVEVNSYFGRGVTPETNVVTAVYEAFGPHPENASLSPDFFAALGIAPPSDDGHYFDATPEEDSEAFNNQMSRAMDKPWKRDEAPLIAKWIDRNGEPIKRLTDALHRPYWYSPMVPPAMVDGRQGTLADVLLPAAQQLRSVARFLACRSMLHAGEGRHVEAMQDALLIIQLGRRAAEGSCVIEYLIGCAIQSIGANQTLQLIQNHRFSGEELQRFAADYERLSPVPVMRSQVTIAEKAMLQEFIDRLADGEYDIVGIYTNESPGNAEKFALGFVDYHLVRQRTLQAFNQFELALNNDDLRLRTNKVGDLRETLMRFSQFGTESIVRNYLMERSASGTISGIVADYVISQMVLPIAQSHSAGSRSIARQEVFRTLFAVEAYEREHGEYPASLSALYPGFLTQPAIDPCSGAEFKYTRTDNGFRFYSFGENCRDDNGQTFGEDPYGDDIVASVTRK